MLRIEGRTAIVTGAARGIGLATVRLLEAQGARVVAVDRDADELQDATGDLDDELVERIAADLLDEAAPAQVVEATIGRWGAIDILVNNAGFTADAPLHKLTDEQWERLGKGHDQLGKALLEEYGVHQQFHTHADSHVGTYKETVRLLEVTNPEYTNLCLDTGHFAYYGGDNLKLIAAHPERIGYLHLKQVDTDLLFDVLKNDVPFATAVSQGIMTEPQRLSR